MLKVASGCALLVKAETVKPRYFSVDARLDSGEPAAPAPYQLRMGPASSASHLDERISFRLSGTEVGFYADRRWTEIPEEYLRRALERELFETRGLRRVVTGAAPTLEVELLAFEEIKQEPPQALVAVRFSLRSDTQVELQESFELRAPIAASVGDDGGEKLAQALSEVLQAATSRIAQRVVERLSELSAEPAPQPGASVLPGASPSPSATRTEGLD